MRDFFGGVWQGEDYVQGVDIQQGKWHKVLVFNKAHYLITMNLSYIGNSSLNLLFLLCNILGSEAYFSWGSSKTH